MIILFGRRYNNMNIVFSNTLAKHKHAEISTWTLQDQFSEFCAQKTSLRGNIADSGHMWNKINFSTLDERFCYKNLNLDSLCSNIIIFGISRSWEIPILVIFGMEFISGLELPTFRVKHQIDRFKCCRRIPFCHLVSNKTGSVLVYSIMWFMQK